MVEVHTEKAHPMRTLILILLLSLCTGVLELLQRGIPPLVRGYAPTVLYLTQAMMFYLALGAVIGLAFVLVRSVLRRVTRRRFLLIFLADILPVLAFLLFYFMAGGGSATGLPRGMNVVTFGALTPGVVNLLVII